MLHKSLYWYFYCKCRITTQEKGHSLCCFYKNKCFAGNIFKPIMGSALGMKIGFNGFKQCCTVEPCSGCFKVAKVDDFCTKHGARSNIAVNQYWESFSFQETFKAANVKTITARNPSTL